MGENYSWFSFWKFPLGVKGKIGEPNLIVSFRGVQKGYPGFDLEQFQLIFKLILLNWGLHPWRLARLRHIKKKFISLETQKFKFLVGRCLSMLLTHQSSPNAPWQLQNFRQNPLFIQIHIINSQNNMSTQF